VDLTSVDWEKVGIIAVLGALVVSMIVGLLVPKSTHDRAISAVDKANSDRDRQTDIASMALKALTEHHHNRRGRA
jgi:hypothetical protein